jgi:hypothetical protein
VPTFDHCARHSSRRPRVARDDLLAINSKLRDCDVVALKVEDVAPSGHAVDRQPKKTGQPGRFELTEQTRQAVDDYKKATGK